MEKNEIKAKAEYDVTWDHFNENDVKHSTKRNTQRNSGDDKKAVQSIIADDEINIFYDISKTEKIVNLGEYYKAWVDKGKSATGYIEYGRLVTSLINGTFNGLDFFLHMIDKIVVPGIFICIVPPKLPIEDGLLNLAEKLAEHQRVNASFCLARSHVDLNGNSSIKLSKKRLLAGMKVLLISARSSKDDLDVCISHIETCNTKAFQVLVLE